MLEFTVYTESTILEITSIINTKLKEGWKRDGQMQVFLDNDEIYVYTQVFVRTTEEIKV